jgi:hypothetical protein
VENWFWKGLYICLKADCGMVNGDFGSNGGGGDDDNDDDELSLVNF